jgi:hypothetical protein
MRHLSLPLVPLLAIAATIAFCPVAGAQVSTNVGATPMPYVPGPTGPPIIMYGQTSPGPSKTPYQPFRESPRGVYKMFSGVVRANQGYKLKLIDGRDVYLDKETIIEPTGGTIRRGMQIAIHGYFRPSGGITARYIVIENGDGQPH